MRYLAAAPATLRIEPLGALTAIYHRASGITHLLAEPAPELLAALSSVPLTQDELIERFALSDGDRAALAMRLGELVEAGLVEATDARP